VGSNQRATTIVPQGGVVTLDPNTTQHKSVKRSASELPRAQGNSSNKIRQNLETPTIQSPTATTPTSPTRNSAAKESETKTSSRHPGVSASLRAPGTSGPPTIQSSPIQPSGQPRRTPTNKGSPLTSNRPSHVHNQSSALANGTHDGTKLKQVKLALWSEFLHFETHKFMEIVASSHVGTGQSPHSGSQAE
jgi:hypothetical protein